MSVVVDASSPAMVNGSGTGNLTCASFTPPAGSFLVAVACGGYGNTPTIAISDSGAGTWTSRVTSNSSSGDGCVQISTRVIGSSSSMTVTAAYTNLSGGRMLGVYVMTGADTTSVGASTTLVVSNSTTMTKSLTTTVNGSLVVGGVDNSNPTGATASLAANTAWPSMSGTDPVTNSTDQVGYGIIKASSTTGTPGAKTYGVTWSATAYGQMALLEVVPPAVSNISASDTSGPAANNAVVQANIAGTDTGSGADSASLSVAIITGDSGTGTDAVSKITVQAADAGIGDEANKVVSGGSTLAFGSDVITASESGPVLIRGAVDTGGFVDASQAAISGTLPAGPRIVRIQPD